MVSLHLTVAERYGQHSLDEYRGFVQLLTTATTRSEGVVPATINHDSEETDSKPSPSHDLLSSFSHKTRSTHHESSDAGIGAKLDEVSDKVMMHRYVS